MTAIEIFVFKGSRFLGSRCYSKPTIVIGRGHDATLKLNDVSVSERHAIIRVEGQDLVLADSGGNQEGVLVNGERISVCRITDLDEVVIGPFRLKVTILGKEEEVGFGTARSLPAAPEHLPPEDSTEPRARPDKAAAHREPAFEDMDTIVGRSSVPARQAGTEFAARDQLARRPGPADPGPGYDEPPLHLGAPEGGRGGAAMDEAVREFTQEPGQAKRSGRRGKKAPQRAAAPSEHKELAHSSTAPQPTFEDPGGRSFGRSTRADTEFSEKRDPGLNYTAPGPLDEDDEEDEEETWVEPFSLLENIVRERFKSPVRSEPYLAVEMIHYRGNEILDLQRANPNQSITIGPDKFHLLSLENDDRAFLYFQREFSGTLVAKGKARPLKNFCNNKYLVEGFDNLYAVVLKEGDYAQIIHGQDGFLLRFIKPPILPAATLGLKLKAASVQTMAASVACHLLALVLIAVLSPEQSLAVDGEAERFAKVALKDINLEEAIKEPEPEIKKEDAPKDESKPPQEVPKATPKPQRVVKRPRPGPPEPPPAVAKQQAQQKKQVENVLSALENIAPAAAGPGRSDLKAMASNISAVRVRGGASSGFKVSGVIGKIPGGGVRLASGLGGGGGKDTKVGSQLLAGGSGVGKIAALEGTGSRVRGRVGKAPTRAIKATGGVLDRAAIQQVVSQHMHQVQACYERQLITSPGLAGKVVFDWTISPSGVVTSARQVSSSMRSPAVASCILDLIRTWRFPSPVGGAVEVRYPFVFRVQGF